MEQPTNPNPREDEPKTAKIESADIKVDFLTDGEKLREKEEEKLSDERLELFKLSAESDKISHDVLKEYSDEIIRDLAEDYYNNNEDLIRQKTGFYEKNISREAKHDIVKKDEIGAYNDLKNKKGYWSEVHFDKLAIADGYDEIRAQLKLGKMRIESPVLLLNALEWKTKEIKSELEATDKSGAFLLFGADRMNREKKRDQIFFAQVELAEKIYGNSLLGEADKKLISKSNLDKRGETTKDIELRKEEALKEIKEKIFGKEWDDLDEKAKGEYGNDFNRFAESKTEKQIQIIGDDAKKYGIDQRTVLGLMDSGYDLENFKTKGFFRRKFYVASDGKGLSKKEFKRFIKSSQDIFEKEINEQVAQMALQKAFKEQIDIKKIFDELREKISKLAKNPDEAEGGIVENFANIKKRIIAEGIKNSVMKGEKSLEQLEKIAKEFGGDAEDKKEFKSRFLDNVINRKGGLENLTGDFNEDLEIITGFMEDYEIPANFIDQLAVDEKSGNKWAAGEMGKIRNGYKDNIRKKKGFTAWMVDFISTMTNPPKEQKNNKKISRKPI